MTEISELKSWIAFAEQDYSAATTLLALKRPLLAAVCFHAQQCAEKYLKALLILKDFDFPKTHDPPKKPGKLLKLPGPSAALPARFWG